MDARYKYASEIMQFRLRQVEEFYAPALVNIEQSRVVYDKLRWAIKQEKPDIPLGEFRLLDHIYEFKSNTTLNPLVDRILTIGGRLTELICQKAGLIEGGITSTFIDYQGHFEILRAARDQEPDKEEKEGWHEYGYYPRLLNREIREGYKAVLAHLENYKKAGDQIIRRLLKQKVVETERYRRQLVANLRFYEGHAKEYSAKFDKFDLSKARERFIAQVEATRDARRQVLPNGMIRVLDVGCGTGRDAYEFIKKGYAVTAVDASPAMLRESRRKMKEASDTPENDRMKNAAMASRTLERTFDEIEFRDEFDGVWAAASLLHIPYQQMERALSLLVNALKPSGILFMSFKHGLGEYEYDARYFTYYTRRQIRALMEQTPDAQEIEVWLSDAHGNNLPAGEQSRAWLLERLNRYDRSLWLNVLARRRPT
jgi:SAM-dependent methyltransferase